MARRSVTLRVQVRIIPCLVGLIAIGRVQETMTGIGRRYPNSQANRPRAHLCRLKRAKVWKFLFPGSGRVCYPR